MWKNKTVTEDVYEDLIISKLLPAVMVKWPRRDKLSRKIYIQQDGAKNHISEDDKVFKEALVEKGINGKLHMQAANSPNVNLLEFGFFRAIQSFNNTAPKNEEELIQAVSMAYESYPWNKINHTWVTLHCCFNQIIMHNGDNDYNIDHISEEKLECIGQLPDVMDVVEDVAQLFNTNNSTNYEMDASTNEETDDKQTQT